MSPQTASMRRTPAATPPSDDLEQADVAGAATWVPPHSSFDEPMSSTRTSSPYFSPNSIMAPVFCASSIGHHARFGRGVGDDLVVDDALDARISSAVTGWVWAKSKRVLSGSTCEPFCCTWSPSTSRSALCIRWVAEWLRAVRRARQGVDLRRDAAADFQAAGAHHAVWPKTLAWIFCVSSTAKMPCTERSSPRSPTWPPDSA
jgi:hypothetical protein